MKKYNYEEVLEECESFSKLRLNRNLIFIRIVLLSLNPIGLWIWDVLLWLTIWSVFFFIGTFDLSITSVLWFIGTHFLYWEFFGKKNANSLIEDIDIEQVRMSLKALKETKRNRSKKESNSEDSHKN